MRGSFLADVRRIEEASKYGDTILKRFRQRLLRHVAIEVRPGVGLFRHDGFAERDSSVIVIRVSPPRARR